jgi:hypothetical protein
MMFEELADDVMRRREINDNVLSKIINKEGSLSAMIPLKTLKTIPTINFESIKDHLTNDVHLKFFGLVDGKYPTEVKSGKFEALVHLRYFEIINIIDKGELV